MNVFDKIGEFFKLATSNVGVGISALVSVIAFTIVFFYIIRFMIKNNSAKLVVLFVVAMVLSTVIVVPNPNVNNLLLLVIPLIFVFAFLILFSVEIKRIIWTHKSSKGEGALESTRYDEEKVDKCIEEIIKAVQDMSKNDVGAIIVLANDNVPSQILDSGVRIESDISSQLIESVFFPKTPLHDGAMIIDGTKIVAAGCFLPLSQNINNIPKDLGTRHRAGIGVTETIDVVSIIVSEETGIISTAKAGKITRYADYSALKKVLGEYYWQDLTKERR